MTARLSNSGRISTVQFLRTDAGTVRTRNEDNLLAMPETSLWAVCDGMGGHDAGDYASQYIVEALRACPASTRHGNRIRALTNTLSRCNRHLLDYARQNHVALVGSTVVVLTLHRRQAVVIWAGDSRAYLLRDARLRMISRDHSVAEERLDHPGQPDSGEAPGAITRAVGGGPTLECDLACVETCPGDCWLLCSDGVYGVLGEAEIVRVLQQAQDPASALVEQALAAGSRDNCTAIVVRVEAEPERLSTF